MTKLWEIFVNFVEVFWNLCIKIEFFLWLLLLVSSLHQLAKIICLGSVLLCPGRSVYLEQPRRTNFKHVSHILFNHGGKYARALVLFLLLRGICCAYSASLMGLIGSCDCTKLNISYHLSASCIHVARVIQAASSHSSDFFLQIQVPIRFIPSWSGLHHALCRHSLRHKVPTFSLKKYPSLKSTFQSIQLADWCWHFICVPLSMSSCGERWSLEGFLDRSSLLCGLVFK